MDKKAQFNFWYFILALFAVMLLQNLWVSGQQIERLPYSEFEQKLKVGAIESIAVKHNTIEGTLRDPGPTGKKRFVTIRVDPELAQDLSKYGVEFTGVIESTFLRDILSWILPVLLFLGIWLFVFRPGGHRVTHEPAEFGRWLPCRPTRTARRDRARGGSNHQSPARAHKRFRRNWCRR